MKQKSYTVDEWLNRTEKLGIRNLKAFRGWIDALIQDKKNKALVDRIVKEAFKVKS